MTSISLDKHRIWAKSFHSSPNLASSVAASILGGVEVGSNNWIRISASLSRLSPKWAEAIHAALGNKGRVLKDTFLIETDKYGNFNENDVRCTGFVSRSADRHVFKPEERTAFSKFLQDRNIREYDKNFAGVLFDKDDRPILASLYTDGECPWTIKSDEEGNLVVTKTINKELDQAIQTASLRSGASLDSAAVSPPMSNGEVGVVAFLDYDEGVSVGVAYKPVANTKNRISVMREESFAKGADRIKPVDISVYQVLSHDAGDPDTSPFYQPIESFVNRIGSGEMKATDEFIDELRTTQNAGCSTMPITASMTDSLLNGNQVDPGQYYEFIYRKFKESPELQNMIDYARKVMSNRGLSSAAARYS